MQSMFKRLKRRLVSSNRPVLNSLEAYHLWAQNYPAKAHNVLMKIEQDAMVSLLPPLADQRVLDLACGTGRYGLIAKEAGAKHVIGIDNSFAMLRQGQLADSLCAHIAALPLASTTVDVVLCALAMGHLPSIEATLREISRIVTLGGTVLISDFHPYQFLSGARRTFDANNTTYEVEHYLHHISDYMTLAQKHGLHLTALAEPTYQQSIPVVVVMRFNKAP